MSSRDPDELREELAAIQFDGESELLADLRSEARQTVAAQKETLDDIDGKASRILRLNVLLIGVIVSAISIAGGGGDSTALGETSSFTNLYVKAGVGSLVLSTVLSAITYTASELDVGVSSNNLTNLVRADLKTKKARELLVKNYIYRINFNRSTNIRNTPLITCTIVLLVTGVIFLALGTYSALIRPVPWWLRTVALLLLAVIIVVSDLISQISLAFRDLREWR